MYTFGQLVVEADDVENEMEQGFNVKMMYEDGVGTRSDGHITSTVGKCTIYEKDLGIDHTSYEETVLLKRLLGRSEVGLDQKMNKERNEKHRGFILHGQKIWKTKLEEHRRELIHERM